MARALEAAFRSRLNDMGDHEPPKQLTSTTHFSVVDAEGNLCAVTQTLLSIFGSRVVSPSTGLLLNNGIMWFDPRPGSANAIAPGARPLCNMCPVIVTPKTGHGPRFAGGASGGRRILASVYQMLAWTVDFGMGLEDAAHWPRIDVSGPDQTSADLRLPAEVLAALEAAGPTVVVEHGVLPINFACPNMIRRDADGTEHIEGKMDGQGNVDDLQAVWHLYPVDDGHTVLKLELLIVPKLPVPGSVVTGELEYAADKAVSASRDRAETRAHDAGSDGAP